jgi:hypothetical protein
MTKPRGVFLIYFLGMVMMLFIGILIYVWIEAKKANPVMLDDKGRPLASFSFPPSSVGWALACSGLQPAVAAGYLIRDSRPEGRRRLKPTPLS